LLTVRQGSRTGEGTFDADPVRTVKALFRRGSPKGVGKPGRLAFVRREGGWFGGADQAPALPLDESLLTEEDLHRYASTLAANGFFGPNAWYMNGSANLEYARSAANPERLPMPVLFLHAAYDFTCETSNPLLVQSMRNACPDLVEVTLPTGHWMAQERPGLVNAALARWLGSFRTGGQSELFLRTSRMCCGRQQSRRERSFSSCKPMSASCCERSRTLLQ
jgi:pimeloyl-ACP methyl ester carboxylesterase